MPRPTRSRDADRDPLAPYRRLRSPMPPPERIERDRRRDLEEAEARREIDEARTAPPGPDAADPSTRTRAAEDGAP